MNVFECIEILLVEDDRGYQKLMKSTLEKDKVINSTKCVSTCEEALDYLSKSYNEGDVHSLPNLILLDLTMPGMGGKEFLKIVKNDERFNTIPVVVLTASDAEEDVVDSFKLQAAGYIRKPVGIKSLQKTIRNLNEYWFVICKRVDEEHINNGKKDKCFISGQ
jgi:CheY-like chemotaxis protein